MKLIGGLLKPSAGELLVGGQVPFGVSAEDRMAAVRYVPQRVYEFFLYGSIAEEWRAVLKRTDRSNHDLEEQLRKFGVQSSKLLNPVDLPELEAWRFALMLCAVTGPKVLLVDEVPSYSSGQCISVLTALAEERRSRKLSTIIATHRETPLVASVDRIIQLRSGPQQ